MKKIDSIEALKELSNEFRNIENLREPVGEHQDLSKACSWRSQFLNLVEEMENKLKKTSDE
jgi:hypothetical protein